MCDVILHDLKHIVQADIWAKVENRIEISVDNHLLIQAEDDEGNIYSYEEKGFTEAKPVVRFDEWIGIKNNVNERNIVPGREKGGKDMAMKVEIRDNKLCIEIDLEIPTPSASGKTLVVASTRGNAVTDVMVDGKPVTIGLNAYIKK
jgi:hypothetical protein